MNYIRKHSIQQLLKPLLTTLLLFICLSLFADTEPTDFMRSTGKIYVCVAVIVSIFIGIVLFMIRMDRKLSKLEQQIIDK